MYRNTWDALIHKTIWFRLNDKEKLVQGGADWVPGSCWGGGGWCLLLLLLLLLLILHFDSCRIGAALNQLFLVVQPEPNCFMNQSFRCVPVHLLAGSGWIALAKRYDQNEADDHRDALQPDAKTFQPFRQASAAGRGGTRF